jgi:hypothetical protein
MSARLCPSVPDSFTEASDLKKFFDDDDQRKILENEKRESIKLPCQTNLFFGFFFDGTKNNYVQGAAAKNQSNIARLYDCFPGQSVVGVLPEDSNWKHQADKYNHFFRVYVPGVASPFSAVKDTGEGKDLKMGAGFGARGEDRIKWALIQAINNVHRYFYGPPMLSPDEAFLELGGIELTRWQRKRMQSRYSQSYDNNENQQKDTREVFERLLKRLHSKVSLHWTDPETGKPEKAEPGQVHKIYISMFGFSRGAAQARAFANWLMSLCELDARLVGRGMTRSLGGFEVHFDFLGLFDTVASVGIANTMGDSFFLSKFDGHGAWADADDSLRVQGGLRCLHLVSAHEVRRSFPVDSISIGQSTPANAEEMIFPGVHSDLGSGYCPKEQGRGEDELGSDMLARVPLLYMYREARLAGVPLKLDLAPPNVKNKFKISPSTIKAVNDYLATCTVTSGTLTDIMREQGKNQILWHKARRVSGPTPLEKTESYKRATNFDKNDLHSANLEFEEEIKDFEEWLAGKGEGFKPQKQKPGFGNDYEHEWEEIATWWKAAPPLSEAALNFFDNYVHDSHAWFKLDDEYPDNEPELQKKLLEWEQRRLNAIAERERMRAGNSRGHGESQNTAQGDGLTPDQRRAAQEYAETKQTPIMLTSGRESKKFLLLTLRGGYLRFRKVYAGADGILISDNERLNERKASAA